jgi:hypothetical protein
MLLFQSLFPVDLAFQATEAIYNEASIEVIDLVLQNDGKKPFGLNLQGPSIEIQSRYPNALITGHLNAESRHTEAPLFPKDLALTLLDHGIDEGQRLEALLLGGDIQDDDPKETAHLGGGQSDPWGLVHGIEHVLDESPDPNVYNFHRLGDLPERGIRIFQDGKNAHGPYLAIKDAKMYYKFLQEASQESL